jgi:ribosomal-protein-alanine N-acetyltransferase
MPAADQVHGVHLLLRRAIDGDMDEVSRIEAASFADPWSAQEFRAVLSVPHAIFLVASDDRAGRLAGYVVTMTVLDEAEILNIAVDPPMRGATLGARLLDAALAEVEARGAKKTFLEVRESNEPARKLYTSRGFEEISRRRKYYQSPVEDALVLSRAIQ